MTEGIPNYRHSFDCCRSWLKVKREIRELLKLR